MKFLTILAVSVGLLTESQAMEQPLSVPTGTATFALTQSRIRDPNEILRSMNPRRDEFDTGGKYVTEQVTRAQAVC
jgi:hypothetical protein